MAQGRDVHKVLIIGKSGGGKTYSFRNLDREKTAYIAPERKPLPFRKKFKMYFAPTNHVEAMNALKKAGESEAVDAIVFDSLSAWLDMLLAACRRKYKGFDVWMAYSEAIGQFMEVLTACPKEVFVTAHYEMLDMGGAAEKRAKVKGKEWEGLIEKDFTITVFADSMPNKLDPSKRPEYVWHLANAQTSAKCPPDIYGEDTTMIENDAAAFLVALRKYAAAEDQTETGKGEESK